MAITPRRRSTQARRAHKKLHTISGRLLRELERELNADRLTTYKKPMALYWKAITQQRSDADKIYSLHKPFTVAIAKSKAHKKYEFGNKPRLITHPARRVILVIKCFEGNLHDSQTIESLLEQIKSDQRPLPREIIYDRGGRGVKEALGVRITTPDKAKTSDSETKKRRMRRRFQRRAGIEPIIGHLKSDHRLGKNYLHGEESRPNQRLFGCSRMELEKMDGAVGQRWKKCCILLGCTLPVHTAINTYA